MVIYRISNISLEDFCRSKGLIKPFDELRWRDYLEIVGRFNPLEDIRHLEGQNIPQEINTRENLEVTSEGIHLPIKGLQQWGYTYPYVLSEEKFDRSLLMGYFHDHGEERVYVPQDVSLTVIPCFECEEAILLDPKVSENFKY